MKMRNTTAILAAAAALTLTVAGAAQADETPGPPEEHGHMLVLGLQFGDGGPFGPGGPVGYRKCVDVAAGKALPLHAHHGGLHAGRAGDALRNAGHFPVPTAPLTPFENCADLAIFFGK
jgi:hypothetical protein